MEITEKSKFTFNGNDTDMTMLDFWMFQFSNIYDKQGEIAEYIVAKALGQSNAYNKDYWTLYDISYRKRRIEVKESSYYHAWQTDEEPKSMQRVFGITKANSNHEKPNEENRYERQNDVYVFCLNTGFTKEEAFPLNLNNWKFYIVPTSFINEKCGDNKSISLSKIKKFGFTSKSYDEIKQEIDKIIDEIEKHSA